MCSIGLTTRQRTHPFGLFGQLKPMDCQVFVLPRDVRIEHCLGAEPGILLPLHGTVLIEMWGAARIIETPG
jgi:hypothetical protein